MDNVKKTMRVKLSKMAKKKWSGTRFAKYIARGRIVSGSTKEEETKKGVDTTTGVVIEPASKGIEAAKVRYYRSMSGMQQIRSNGGVTVPPRRLLQTTDDTRGVE